MFSQTPAPTYTLVKHLNQMLTPYVPSRYSLQSSVEFLEAIKDTPGTRIIASLNMESPFTNVPVDETIDIILEHVYRSQLTETLNIPEASLCMLLELNRQKDGMAMGSPLGVLFANFHVGTMEKSVFTRMQQPRRYIRYIDDIFKLTQRMR
ncbi:uncharacterized protein LOC135197735 [Macrobrachium nipponense]|uniref:uncharacterized protein LOC135197735 n=1 Tax=Macrobrachium nipponense TaxID=159736 RepID=UPI0030C83B99